jgi:hypothetical protein
LSLDQSASFNAVNSSINLTDMIKFPNVFLQYKKCDESYQHSEFYITRSDNKHNDKTLSAIWYISNCDE